MVESGLLHKGSRLIVAGEAGSGKSYLTLQLLLESAMGESWFGLFPLRQEFSCLYIQTEITQGLLKDRLLRWQAKYRLPEIYIETRKSFTIVHEQQSVLEFVQAHNVDIIGFDPLYQMHLGDENMVHTIRPAEDAFDFIVGDQRAALIDHHINKASQFQGSKPALTWLRGSSAWAGWADTVFLVLSQPGLTTMWLNIIKARNCPKALPGAIELKWQPEGGKFLQVTEIREDSEFVDLLDIVGTLNKRGAVARELMERRGVAKSKAYQIIAQALRLDIIQEVSDQLVLRGE